MLLERSLNEQFLSNTYLVADESGGTAALVDAGGPVDPLLEKVERESLTLAHVLLTHRHHDHIAVTVDDLDGTLERLAEKGIEPEKPPYTVREGGSRLCFVRDPDGYRIELIERS